MCTGSSCNFCTLYRAKNELDDGEFMFFLTGGVGLDNKVRLCAQWFVINYDLVV